MLGLATELGIDASAVTLMLQPGGRRIQAHEMPVIERYLGVTLAELQNGDSPALTSLRIGELMAQRGWTLRALADRSGLSVSMLSRAAKGERSCSLQALEALAKAFDVSVPELFEASASSAPALTWWQRLGQLMHAKGLSVQDIERASGVPLKTVYSLLAGDVANPRGDVMERLARAVGTTERFLRYGDEPAAVGDLRTLEGLVEALQAVRNQAAATDPPDPNLVRAMLALIDAVAEQVAKLRKV
jgi:transcriptional regulator with XRE-family HTH domain